MLEAPPRLLVGELLVDLGRLVAVVVLVGGAIGHPALGEDEDVGAGAEGVRVHGDGSEVDVTVASRCLTGC